VTVRADGTIFFEQQPTDRAGLRDALLRLMAEEPDAALVLRADAQAPFQAGLTVMDVAREVGFEQLEIPTQPVEGP
jgi:biopolymer transport protein ExbD